MISANIWMCASVLCFESPIFMIMCVGCYCCMLSFTYLFSNMWKSQRHLSYWNVTRGFLSRCGTRPPATTLGIIKDPWWSFGHICRAPLLDQTIVGHVTIIDNVTNTSSNQLGHFDSHFFKILYRESTVSLTFHQVGTHLSREFRSHTW